MMMSDISGISDINRSIVGRGTSIARISRTARSGIDQLPPLRNEISARNCVGPRVDGRVRSPVNGYRMHTSFCLQSLSRLIPLWRMSYGGLFVCRWRLGWGDLAIAAWKKGGLVA